MRNIQQGTLALLSACLLFTCPALCSAEDSKPASSVQGGASQDATSKKEEGKPSTSEEAKKKAGSDDEPSCNN